MSLHLYEWRGVDPAFLAANLSATVKAEIGVIAPPVTISVTLDDDLSSSASKDANKLDLDAAMLVMGWVPV
jgi:hypothetical protein